MGNHIVIKDRKAIVEHNKELTVHMIDKLPLDLFAIEFYFCESEDWKAILERLSKRRQLKSLVLTHCNIGAS